MWAILLSLITVKNIMAYLESSLSVFVAEVVQQRICQFSHTSSAFCYFFYRCAISSALNCFTNDLIWYEEQGGSSSSGVNTRYVYQVGKFPGSRLLSLLPWLRIGYVFRSLLNCFLWSLQKEIIKSRHIQSSCCLLQHLNYSICILRFLITLLESIWHGILQPIGQFHRNKRKIMP